MGFFADEAQRTWESRKLLTSDWRWKMADRELKVLESRVKALVGEPGAPGSCEDVRNAMRTLFPETFEPEIQWGWRVGDLFNYFGYIYRIKEFPRPRIMKVQRLIDADGSLLDGEILFTFPDNAMRRLVLRDAVKG